MLRPTVLCATAPLALALALLPLAAEAACPTTPGPTPVCTTGPGGWTCSLAVVPVTGPEIVDAEVWTDVSGDICVRVSKPAVAGGTPAWFSEETLAVPGPLITVTLDVQGSPIADHIRLEDGVSGAQLMAPRNTMGAIAPIDVYVNGQAGDDVILGSRTSVTYTEELVGDQGADEINGREGADIIRGGMDDDTLFSGAGVYDDQVFGNEGVDDITVGSGALYVHGGSEDDTITCEANYATGAGTMSRILGGDDTDEIIFTGPQHIDVDVRGGGGNDRILTSGVSSPFHADLGAWGDDGDDELLLDARVYGTATVDTGTSGSLFDLVDMGRVDGDLSVYSHGDAQVTTGTVGGDLTFVDLADGHDVIVLDGNVVGSTNLALAGSPSATRDEVSASGFWSLVGGLAITGSAGNVIDLACDIDGVFGITFIGGDDDIALAGAMGASSITTVDIDAGDGTNFVTLSGIAHDEFVYDGGADGDEVLVTGTIGGASTVNLGDGFNVVSNTGSVADLAITGGSGADTITVDTGATVSGDFEASLGDGDDEIDLYADIGGSIDVTLAGGDDTFEATGIHYGTVAGGTSVVRGGDDEDVIRGTEGDDTLFGGNGPDWLYGNGGADTIRGGSPIATSDGIDKIRGGAGDDILQGDAAGDTLCGDAGIDHLSGNAGADKLFSGRHGTILNPEIEQGGPGMPDVCSPTWFGAGTVSKSSCEASFVDKPTADAACAF